MKIRKGPAHKAGPLILMPVLSVESLRGVGESKVKIRLDRAERSNYT